MLRKTLFLLLGFSLFSVAAHAEKTIQLLANTSPPYADARLEQQGLALELVKHVFSRTEYSPKVKIETWGRAMEGVKIGVYDALATAWYSDERSKDFLFSEPYLSSKIILVKASSDPTVYRSTADLAGKRLGVRTDYAYGVDLDAIPGLRLVQENHLIQNLLNLQAGKVDLVIGDLRTMNYQLREYLGGSLGKFRVVDANLPTRERHVAAGLSVKGHKDIITAFNKALAETKKDGSYKAIIRKWDAKYGGM
jgi:polar amino acid transport system substrate-binding protein